MQSDKNKVNRGQRVLVIGGRGFIGRNVVAGLARLGASVIIGSRVDNGSSQYPIRQIRMQQVISPEHWERLIAEVDVVINCVGILRQRYGESYEQIHNHAVAMLANACAKKDIRYVHISVLGISNPVTSRFVRSKRRGEQAMRKSQADWYIVRPSLVDGIGVDGKTGYGVKWFRRVAAWPIRVAPVNAIGVLAPINILDLAAAIAQIALSKDRPTSDDQRIYELGGEQLMTVLEYIKALNPASKAIQIRIPSLLARLASHVFDLLHITPYSFGHYELLKFDNQPVTNRITELLERKPRSVEAISQISIDGGVIHEQ